MNKLQIAKDFANWLYPKKNALKIDEIILYGSIMKKGDGRDIDILLPHENMVFAKLYDGKDFDNTTARVHNLDKMLINNGYIGISDMASVESCKYSIQNNLLSVKFVDKKIFSDRLIYELELQKNHDKEFFNNILSYACIWNPASGDYDIPMQSKYTLPNK